MKTLLELTVAAAEPGGPHTPANAATLQSHPSNLARPETRVRMNRSLPIGCGGAAAFSQPAGRVSAHREAVPHAVAILLPGPQDHLALPPRHVDGIGKRLRLQAQARVAPVTLALARQRTIEKIP